MKPQVLEGEFTEFPASEATGIERRAHGEFIGARGELASYAFGWTTGSDPHAAWFTVGIGAGNPGGGTFHAVVYEHQGDHALTLVDGPFAQVPEGGPDLTADDARAHPDLRFVWWVVDLVMEHDRRAWWMRHWLLGTPCVQSAESFELTEPVLHVRHGRDGVWQLTGATDADDETGMPCHLHHVVDEDPTLVDVLDLGPGQSATRDIFGAPWTRQRSRRARPFRLR